MGKHEAMTPKAIANRIKAKGLQKLRWYCQMCQKQCRDQNGFKCHTTSESHQRQLLLFADNPGRYIDAFSKEFSDGFIDILSRRFGTKRVPANQVYQEYISDRNHLHMNATKWLSLTGYVKWLGRTGIAIVDQNEKGWFITWVDRNPDTVKKQESLAKKKQLDLDDQERLQKFIDKQILKDKPLEEDVEEIIHTEFKRENEEEKIVMKLTKTGPTPEPSSSSSSTEPFINPLNIKFLPGVKRKSTKDDDVFKKPKSALDDIMKEQEKNKEKINRKDYWLTTGIVVKITTKRLGEKYYKKKGVIKEVVDKYVAVLKMLDSGDVLKVDQAHLETVIPAAGRQLCVVNGAYRGCVALLVNISTDAFAATIKIDAGPTRGRVINNVSYEDICKLHKE